MSWANEQRLIEQSLNKPIRVDYHEANPLAHGFERIVRLTTFSTHAIIDAFSTHGDGDVNVLITSPPNYHEAYSDLCWLDVWSTNTFGAIKMALDCLADNQGDLQ